MKKTELRKMIREELLKEDDKSDIKQFAKFISKKINQKYYMKDTNTVSIISDGVMNMLMHHMKKQGWTKK